MPGVARNNDPATTGHGCSPTTTVLGQTGLSSQVFVDGIAVVAQGDQTAVHTIGVPPSCSPHTGIVTSGSGTVYVGGKPLARQGDTVEGAGSITIGSSTVFAGG